MLGVTLVLALMVGRSGRQKVIQQAFARFGADALLPDDGGLAGEGAVPGSFVVDGSGRRDDARQRQRERRDVSIGAVDVIVEFRILVVRAVSHGRAARFAMAMAERRAQRVGVAVLGATRVEAVEVFVFGDADAEVLVVGVVGEVVEAFLQRADAASVEGGLGGAFDGPAGEPGAFGVDGGEGLREEGAGGAVFGRGGGDGLLADVGHFLPKGRVDVF